MADLSRGVRLVTVPTSPDVQLLGDAAVIRGAAALDAYRLLTEGIRTVQRRDCIDPSPRLLLTVAVLKHAAEQAAATAETVMSARGHADVREGVRRGPLVMEEVGIGEAARMLGLSERQTRRLAGTEVISARQPRPGSPWLISRASVQAYITDQESKTA